MEYIIGAIAGAILFVSGFFIGRNIDQKKGTSAIEQANHSNKEISEDELRYIQQFNNYMNYDGRPQS